MESHLESVQITMTKVELADFARNVVEEVLARLDAAERLHTNDLIIVTGTLTVNLPAYEAAVDGTLVKLKTREFALLAELARNVGRVLTRDQLVELAWPDPERVDENRTVDVHIRRVRIALGSAASLVETVHGVGYKLAKVPVRSPIDV